jgi:hypothetical protein
MDNVEYSYRILLSYVHSAQMQLCSSLGTLHIPNYTDSTVEANVNVKGFMTVKLNNVVFHGY